MRDDLLPLSKHGDGDQLSVALAILRRIPGEMDEWKGAQPISVRDKSWPRADS